MRVISMTNCSTWCSPPVGDCFRGHGRCLGPSRKVSIFTENPPRITCIACLRSCDEYWAAHLQDCYSAKRHTGRPSSWTFTGCALCSEIRCRSACFDVLRLPLTSKFVLTWRVKPVPMSRRIRLRRLFTHLPSVADSVGSCSLLFLSFRKNGTCSGQPHRWSCKRFHCHA